MCVTSQKLLDIIDRIEKEISELTLNKNKLLELCDNKLVGFIRDPITYPHPLDSK